MLSLPPVALKESISFLSGPGVLMITMVTLPQGATSPQLWLWTGVFSKTPSKFLGSLPPLKPRVLKSDLRSMAFFQSDFARAIFLPLKRGAGWGAGRGPYFPLPFPLIIPEAPTEVKGERG